MFKKLKVPLSSLKFPLRVQFLIIAISLAVTTTVLGLSAYLTDTDELSSTFHIATGDDLGFELSGIEYDDYDINLGDTVELNAVATISGRHELYVFIEIDTSSGFEPLGLDSRIWRSLPGHSNVYYYGTTDTLVALGGENGNSVDILDSITLSAQAEIEDSYHLTITGYAIEADAVEDVSTPASVFEMIIGD